jgi:DNA-directed RNA polymerase specialized sigma24 family protein
MPTPRSRLLALNDPRLAEYLTGSDEAARTGELERILAGEVQPRVRAVLGTYPSAEWPLEAHDVEDIVGQVTLRVLRKLLGALVLEEESVQSLEAYVTTLTKNALRDFMRRRSPERTRMKSRLRYLFTHDRRLALWQYEGVSLCGLAAWKDRADHEPRIERVHQAAESSGDFAAAPADAVTAAVTALRKPVRLGDLVSAFLPLEAPDVHPAPTAVEAPPLQRDALEARQYLQVLWSEIRELPPKQRAALLLNLRAPGSGNAITLFVSVGIATLEEIAEAAEMPRAALSALWDDLPLDDLRIAAHLGVQRQQVINFRKSARERLARRMATRSGRRQ